jgi:hypothetical protein
MGIVPGTRGIVLGLIDGANVIIAHKDLHCKWCYGVGLTLDLDTMRHLIASIRTQPPGPKLHCDYLYPICVNAATNQFTYVHCAREAIGQFRRRCADEQCHEYHLIRLCREHWSDVGLNP